MHGDGWQELKSLLDFGRLGVEEGGGGLELGGRLFVVVFIVGVVASECSAERVFLILTDSVVFAFVPGSTCIFETFGVILTGELSKRRSTCYPQVVKENAAKKKGMIHFPGETGLHFSRPRNFSLG